MAGCSIATPRTLRRSPIRREQSFPASMRSDVWGKFQVTIERAGKTATQRQRVAPIFIAGLLVTPVAPAQDAHHIRIRSGDEVVTAILQSDTARDFAAILSATCATVIACQLNVAVQSLF